MTIVKQQRHLLITGCARSGTTFAAITLSKTGLYIKHQEVGKFGSVDCFFGRALQKHTYNVILHQVREPLRVIESLHTISKESWNIFCKEEPKIDGQILLLKCMQYWLYWNILCEDLASWTYRVEDMQNVFSHIFTEVNLDCRKWPALKPTINSRRDKKHKMPSLTWGILRGEDVDLTLQIQQLAKKYGYAHACIE